MEAIDEGGSGYDTDDILSQALNMAEEVEDDIIFITQNSFRTDQHDQDDNTGEAEDDAAYFLGHNQASRTSSLDDNTGEAEDDAAHFLGHNQASRTSSLDDNTGRAEDDAAHFLGQNEASRTSSLDDGDTFDPGDINFGLDASNIFENDGPLSGQATGSHAIDPINGQGSPNRFSFMNETEVRKEMEVFVPDNTKRKATWAKNIYCSWKQAAQKQQFSQPIKRALQKDILNLVDKELNLLLPIFFTSVKRQDGEQYQSDTIFSIACGLVKYFEINGKTLPLLSGEQFKSVRNVISNTMRKKVEAGVGLFKKKADPIPQEIEEQLWKNGYLGTDTPQKLLRTMFWLIGVNFGLRGGQEHRSLTIDNFKLYPGYLQYTESISKTYRGGLEHRNIEPHSAKAYSNTQQPERCIVNVYQLYLNKLPTERPQSVFYFNPLVTSTRPVWFSKQPIGKTKLLENVVKDIMRDAGIDGFYTNHSLRATTATRLFNAGVPEQLVREQTGHRSNAIWSYNRPSEGQKRKVSEILQLQKNDGDKVQETQTMTCVQEKEGTQSVMAGKRPKSEGMSFVFNNSNVTFNFK